MSGHMLTNRPAVASRPDGVEARVAELETLDLEGLRRVWRELKGPPTKLRSVDLLRFMLAWDIQSRAYGGLPPEIARTLRRPAPPKPKAPVHANRTRISREWRGRVIEVEVLDGRFLWDGREYASLSIIAREVTGVRWNGPRFFGLRKAQESAA